VSALDTSKYEYVDVAFGGVNRRNNVRKRSSLVVNGMADCYASHNRANEALAIWVKEHKNKNGNPTVEGFHDATWAPDLHFDFDAEDDPARALQWLNLVLNWLEAVGVDLGAVRIYFSGAKGFHLEIPHTLFGGFEPATDLPKRLRRAAKLILGTIPFDTSVYDTLRLWRLENSRNSKTGLYKVRLTTGEARTAGIEEIRALSASPRDTSLVPELSPVADDEWLPNDELVGIWEATLTLSDDAAGDSEERAAPTDQARENLTMAAIAASWPHGGNNTVEGAGTVSRHADYLMGIVGFLARRTDTEHVVAVVAGGAEQAGDRSFLTGRDWRSEIQRIADGAADRIVKGEEVKGLPSLAKHFPGLADVLDALWPGVRITFDDPDSPTKLHAVKTAPSELEEPAAPFPLDVLPPALRRLVVEGAAALPCPADFIAIPLLTAAGVAIGDAIELELKSGWREAANLYTATVGDPGSKKTPSQKLALNPLHRIQQRLAGDFSDEKRRYKDAMEAWDAASKEERGPKPTPPTFRHVVTTDATVEAVAPMLLSGKGALLSREELSAWVKSMNQYRSGGKGADRQAYLSMWSRMMLKIDRKSSAEPVIVPRPFLGVTGGIQPDLLPGLADSESREDGFLDRILFGYPDPVPDAWTAEGVGQTTIAAAEYLFERLYALKGQADPDRDDESASQPHVVRFSEQAMAMWSEWYREHSAELAAPKFAVYIRGPWAKMPGQAARLALVLHCVERVASGEDPCTSGVSDWALGGALELVDGYFKPHARRVYRLLSRQNRDQVVRLLEALKQEGPLLKRDILLKVFQGHVPAARVDAMLEELEAAGLAVSEEKREGPGRPGMWWRAA
jgi:hypothetical protein